MKKKFTNKKIIVVGQVPPPSHGSNVMTQVFLHALDTLKINYMFINKQFSLASSEVEKFRPIKIIRFIKVISAVVKAISSYRPKILLYFISTKKNSLIPDLIILFLSKFLGVHNVLYIHGVGHAENYSNWLFKILYDMVLVNNCSVIALDRLLKNDIKFLTDKIYILPNCLQTNLGAEKENFSCHRKNTDIFNMIFLSNIYRAKGLSVLLKALDLTVRKDTDIKLIIVGDFMEKHHEKKIFRFIKEKKLTDYISFTGSVYGEKKQKLLINADLFLLPSYNEAFPLVILEAMSSGLAVIATDVGAISGMIDEGITGFVVSPGDYKMLYDKIIWLKNNLHYCRQMGRKGRDKFIKTYSFDAYLKRLTVILNNL